uniref:Nectin-4 n=1 Tax=Meleagris gallopavo TaxID=9103 RepID=A0A803XL35_MELGA
MHNHAKSRTTHAPSGAEWRPVMHRSHRCPSLLPLPAGCDGGVVEVQRSVTAVGGCGVTGWWAMGSDGCWVTAVGSRWWWALQCRRWPILNPGPALEEGQGRTLAASCTAEGNPVPTVHWETEVRGANTTRQSQHDHSASVTSEFFVVPGRSMNGKSLTCVVAHPGLRHEKRITHQLSVAYLSDVSVLGHTEEWAEGMEGAALTCLGDGNPPPTYNWTRCGSVPIPTPVPIPVPFPLHLLCTPAAPLCPDEVRRVDLVSASVVVVGVIAAVLLCVLVIVVVVMTLYHKRKTKRISEKYEEELTLTRENSIRRLHSSHSTDTRTQLEETLQLRTESRQGSLRGDSLEEAEGRSYSTLSTVREIETQTEVPVSPLLSPSLEGKEVKEEEEDGGDNPIKQAMTHFVQENGMLQARPSTNGIYINGRGHLV